MLLPLLLLCCAADGGALPPGRGAAEIRGEPRGEALGLEEDNQENIMSQLLGDYDKVKTRSSGSDCVCRCIVRPIKRSDCDRIHDDDAGPRDFYTVETVAKGTDCQRCECLAPPSAVNPCEGEYRFLKLQEVGRDVKLSSILDLLEGSIVGMDLLKLHSITTKLLERLDNVESFAQNLSERQKEKDLRSQERQDKKKKRTHLLEQKVEHRVRVQPQKNQQQTPTNKTGQDPKVQDLEVQYPKVQAGAEQPWAGPVLRGVTFYRAGPPRERGQTSSLPSVDLKPPLPPRLDPTPTPKTPTPPGTPTPKTPTPPGTPTPKTPTPPGTPTPKTHTLKTLTPKTPTPPGTPTLKTPTPKTPTPPGTPTLKTPTPPGTPTPKTPTPPGTPTPKTHTLKTLTPKTPTPPGTPTPKTPTPPGTPTLKTPTPKTPTPPKTPNPKTPTPKTPTPPGTPTQKRRLTPLSASVAPTTFRPRPTRNTVSSVSTISTPLTPGLTPPTTTTSRTSSAPPHQPTTPAPAPTSTSPPTAAAVATGRSPLSWTESSAHKHKPTKKPGVCKDTVSAISEPVEQNSYGLSDGAWMKDARGHGNVIYLTDGHYGNSLLEFRDLDTFRSGVPSNSYQLPYSVAGSGHVVYGGALFYARAFSRDLIRYDLRRRAVSAWTTLQDAVLDETGAHTHAQVRFLVDESGLWLLYPALDSEGFHQEVMLLTRIRPRDLQPIRSFRTGLRRGRYAGSFLVCGVLYAVDRLDRRHANVTYAFDTHTLTHTALALAFTNRYAHTAQLAYCPLDRQIYAWDHGHQLTYALMLAH